MGRAEVWAALRGVAARPDLWSTLIRVYATLVAPRWWRTRPYLPLPDGDYLRFRLLTAYGSEPPHEIGTAIVTYLEWARHQLTLT